MALNAKGIRSKVDSQQKEDILLKKTCILFLLSLFLVQSILYAIRIDKGKFVTQLSQSESYRGEITVRNKSPKATQVKVYLEDFEYTAPYQGAKDFYPPGTKQNSISTWINYSPQEFSLEPYGTKQVSFIIKPNKAVETAYCGVLFFESPLGETQEGTGISLVGRVGSLLFVNPANANKQATIENLSGNLYKITGNFINSGNTFLSPTTTYYIISQDGMVKDRGKLEQLYLLPNDKASIEITIPKDVSPGRYTAVLTSDLKKGDVLVREVDFSIRSSGDIRILEIRD